MVSTDQDFNSNVDANKHQHADQDTDQDTDNGTDNGTGNDADSRFRVTSISLRARSSFRQPIAGGTPALQGLVGSL